MSLLLNALKKAEEGEKPEGTAEAAETAEAAPAPAVAAPAAATTAAPAAETVDFDSIIDEAEEQQEKKRAAHDDDAGEHKKRVDAARVFSAKSSADAPDVSGGGISKLLYTLIGLGAIGAAGYAVVVTGVIPGLDMRAIENFVGLSDAPAPVVQVAPQSDVGAQLQVAEDVVLLPVPDVDVQSDMDFAALRLPENNRKAVGEERYIKQIAFLTGFDITKERNRAIEEQRQLLLDLEIEREAERSVADEPAELEVPVEEVIEIIQTADISREVKVGLDSSTPSDRALGIQVNFHGAAASSSAEGDAAPAAPEAARVAQMEVRESMEGTERQRLIAQARLLYNNGNYLEAEAVYRNVLVASPANLNALRGVAQIALITGRYQSAISSYLTLLSYYPDDPIAIAELTNLRGNADPGSFYEVESALQGALGSMPAVDGRLYFSLGNLYAQHGEWIKAQQAYFEAFSRETANPDYAYNLAVVLDYLNKPALAGRYYEEALRLAASGPAGFSRDVVQARIRDLNQ